MLFIYAFVRIGAVDATGDDISHAPVDNGSASSAIPYGGATGSAVVPASYTVAPAPPSTLVAKRPTFRDVVPVARTTPMLGTGATLLEDTMKYTVRLVHVTLLFRCCEKFVYFSLQSLAQEVRGHQEAGSAGFSLSGYLCGPA